VAEAGPLSLGEADAVGVPELSGGAGLSGDEGGERGSVVKSSRNKIAFGQKPGY